MKHAGSVLPPDVVNWRPLTDEDRRARDRREQDAFNRQRDLEKLAALPPGPNLPPHKRRNARVHVLEEDLDPFIPDGWGELEHVQRDAVELAARTGFTPFAVKYMQLLEWCHGLRGAVRGVAHVRGCGVILSPEWVARKIGCSERWAKELNNRLDPFAPWRRDVAAVKRKNAERRAKKVPELPLPPRPKNATAWISHFRQLKRYEPLTRDLPYAQRTAFWIDAAGKERSWVDLPAVTYIHDVAVTQLRRRATRRQAPSHRRKGGRWLRNRRRTQLRRSPMREDLYRRLKPLYRLLRRRLSPVGELEFTPNNVKPSYTQVFSDANPANYAGWSQDGPPDG